jgi:diphosphomevalonate decarboxylase
MKLTVSAPSNIALIKYMGKTSQEQNRPTNDSLSYTLSNLRSFVQLESTTEPHDRWESLAQTELPEETLGSEGLTFASKDFSLLSPTLSEQGRERFLKHFLFLKKEFKLENQNFVIRSANSFASDCGLASSASSFAALTYAAANINPDINIADKRALAELSRQGSGSSCRSFFKPWSLWGKEGAGEIELPLANLKHAVFLAKEDKKSVSSSEAHKRVTTSLLFRGRIERAEERLKNLIEALRSRNWLEACAITQAEFWDMHALFETAHPAFHYMNPASLAAIEAVRAIWQEMDDGPMVTMDAGPNLHLLFRADQEKVQMRTYEDLRKIGRII